MTYSISLTGHGADGDDLAQVFEDTVRALRTINGDDPGAMLSGTLSGTDGAGNPVAMNAADVEADETVDPTDDPDDKETN